MSFYTTQAFNKSVQRSLLTFILPFAIHLLSVNITFTLTSNI